jgi:flagellar biogenesis protein FliO
MESTFSVSAGALRIILALGITLSLLFLISYLAKRFWLSGMGGKDPTAAVKILSTRYLGGKKTICVVEIEGERLVLGLSTDKISFLTKLGGTGEGT